MNDHQRSGAAIPRCNQQTLAGKVDEAVPHNHQSDVTAVRGTARRRGPACAAFVLRAVARLCLLGGALLVTQLGWAQPSPNATAEPRTRFRPEEIPEAADLLLRRLRAAPPSQTAAARIAEIEDAAAAHGRQIGARVEQGDAAVARAASFGDLDDLRRALQSDAALLEQWKTEVDEEVARVATALDDIARASAVWSATASHAETVAAGEAVIGRVREVRAALDDATSGLRAWRTRVLELSNRLIQERTALDAAIERLRTAAVAEREDLLLPSSAPLWRPEVWSEIRREIPGAPEAIGHYARGTVDYVRANAPAFVLQLLLTAMLMLALHVVARHQRQQTAGAAAASDAARILERPYAIALLCGLLAAPVLQPLVPRNVRQVLGMLALIPTARIVLHLSTRANGAFFAALFVLMLFDRLGSALTSLPGLARLAFLLALATGIGVARWSSHRLRDARDMTWLQRTANLAAVTLGLALVAEFCGWTILAGVVGRAVIAGAVAGLYVYVTVVTAQALVALAWTLPLVQRSRLVAGNRQILDRVMHRGLRWLGAGLWVFLWLTSVGLRTTAADAAAAALHVGISVGALSISIGGVLAFALTLWVAFTAARIVNAILEAEVYPRTYLPRGLPYALSTLVRYGIYLVGFLFALAAAGVELGQVTFLIGGLGIGIGLGLQDLVKDFAAGLTLLLERRVHVGDAIQSGDKEISGRVLAIGMRSTVVRNWNGAEVVVPNATLLSGLVTNWTLSDRLVRLEVQVGVAYGTDPERVVALLLEVAASVDHVVANPPPLALFVGFGESSLDFELRVWTDEGYDRFAATKSEIALAICRALSAASITIPFPQRDLHLASVAPEVRAALGVAEPKT